MKSVDRMASAFAQKEAAETLYWLKLLVKSGYLPDDEDIDSVIADCDEIIRLLVSSIKTAKLNNSTIPNS